MRAGYLFNVEELRAAENGCEINVADDSGSGPCKLSPALVIRVNELVRFEGSRNYGVSSHMSVVLCSGHAAELIRRIAEKLDYDHT